jgi:hypothetical protein
MIAVFKETRAIFCRSTCFLNMALMPLNNFQIIHAPNNPYNISPILKGSQPVRWRKKAAKGG